MPTGHQDTPKSEPKISKRDALLEHHEAMNAEGVTIMVAKNADYAGQDVRTPFRNFQLVEALGICSTEVGMLVRMCDKLSRLANFVKSGTLAVKDESARDTAIDLRNYLVLFDAYRASKGKAP